MAWSSTCSEAHWLAADTADGTGHPATTLDHISLRCTAVSAPHTTQSEPKFCRTNKHCEKRKRLAVFSRKYRKQFARPGRSLVPHTRLLTSSRLPACRKHRSLPRLHSQQAVLLQSSPGGGNQVGIDRRALAAAGAAEAVAHAPRFLQGTQQPPCRPGGGAAAHRTD